MEFHYPDILISMEGAFYIFDIGINKTKRPLSNHLNLIYTTK